MEITRLEKPEHKATVEHVHRIMTDCGFVQKCDSSNVKISYCSKWLCGSMPGWMRGKQDPDHIVEVRLSTGDQSRSFAVHCRELSGHSDKSMRKCIKYRFNRAKPGMFPATFVTARDITA